MGNAQAEMSFNADTAANPSSDSAPATDERQESATGAPEKRERRSRDRYGRDRRERNTNNDNAAAENANVEGKPTETSESEGASAPRSYFDRGNSQSSAETSSAAPAQTAAPAQASTPSEPAPAPTAAKAPAGLPKVQAYELPMASLIQVAEGSGLQWVNSDPEKIAQVQAAIAAEPKPVHVPRERPPAVVFDDGPLILVETRKDLSNMKLPF
jgi:ribonuclease E